MADILLVDDHAIVREARAYVFEREGGFRVVAQAESLREARKKLSVPFDVAIVDLGLPDGDGGDLVGELRAAQPKSTVLVLSASLDDAQFARAVEAGASGALHKSRPLEEILDAVERLRAGETLLSMEEVVNFLRLAGRERERRHEAKMAAQQLTGREKEVLQALADGLNDAEIAERLRVTYETVRTHMTSILTKLRVSSRLQALLFAIRHGIVELR